MGVQVVTSQEEARVARGHSPTAGQRGDGQHPHQAQPVTRRAWKVHPVTWYSGHHAREEQ
jgi:hypothetical protein